MRLLTFAVILAVCVIGQPAVGAVVITEVASTSGAPAGGDLAGLDWWELTNTGPGSVLLDGYQWKDSDGGLPGSAMPDTAIFPNGITVAAGESIIIHEGGVEIEDDFRLQWALDPAVQILHDGLFTGNNTFSGLSSGGDQVNLYDNLNNLVSGVAFGPSTAGRSFEWDTDGNSLGLSVLGENGAYGASNNRVGSPGIAVPEPATLVLIGLAVCGACFLRCRS
jgi:hypothetical protein